MSSFIINSLRNGTLYRRKDVLLEDINPVVNLLVSISYILFTMLVSLEKSLLILIVTLATVVVGARKKEILYLLRFLIVIATLSSLFVGLFYSLKRTLSVFLRIMIIGLWTSQFIVATNPDMLAKSLERTGLPAKISLIIPLSMKFIPTIAKDAEETLTALYFRDELNEKTFNPRKFTTPLTLLLASSLWRTRYVAEALASKGVLKGRKTFYIEEKFIKIKDVSYLTLMASAIILISITPRVFLNLIYKFLIHLLF